MASTVTDILIRAALERNAPRDIIDQALTVADEEKTIEILAGAALSDEQKNHWASSTNAKFRKAIAGRHDLPVDTHAKLVATERNGSVIAAALKTHPLTPERIDELIAGGTQVILDAFVRNSHTQKINTHPAAIVPLLQWVNSKTGDLTDTHTKRTAELLRTMDEACLDQLAGIIDTFNTTAYYNAWYDALMNNPNITTQPKILSTLITRHETGPHGTWGRSSAFTRWIDRAKKADFEPDTALGIHLAAMRTHLLNLTHNWNGQDALIESIGMLLTPVEQRATLDQSKDRALRPHMPATPAQLKLSNTPVSVHDQVAHLLELGHSLESIWQEASGNPHHLRKALAVEIVTRPVSDELARDLIDVLAGGYVDSTQRRCLSLMLSHYQAGHQWPLTCLEQIVTITSLTEALDQLRKIGVSDTDIMAQLLKDAHALVSEDEGKRLREVIHLADHRNIPGDYVLDVPLRILTPSDNRTFAPLFSARILELSRTYGPQVIPVLDAMWNDWSGTIRELFDTIVHTHEIGRDQEPQHAAPAVANDQAAPAPGSEQRLISAPHATHEPAAQRLGH